MRDERVDEVGHIQKEQHGRDTQAQFFVGDAEIVRVPADVACVVEYGRKQERDDDEDKESREQSGPLGVEGLPFSRSTANNDSEPQAKQAGTDDRPRDLGLNHSRLAAG